MVLLEKRSTETDNKPRLRNCIEGASLMGKKKNTKGERGKIVKDL